MPEYGKIQFVQVAVQVIPVLVVVVMADQFIRRDADHPVHRIHASTAIAVGLGFAIFGEVAGFQALLTGPTEQTIPLVAAGLIALAATALLPRLAELHVSRHSDVARRFVNRMLPMTIGGVGAFVSSLQAPLWWRIVTYAFIAVSWLASLADAAVTARKDLAADGRMSRRQKWANVRAAKDAAAEVEQALQRGDVEAAEAARRKVLQLIDETRRAISVGTEQQSPQGKESEIRMQVDQVDGGRTTRPSAAQQTRLAASVPPPWMLASVAVAVVAVFVRRRRKR
ncbi:hypothetical protein FXF50_23290 [Micromonospora sp. AP08]|uniref:hypothetical protein n=1 Tax=Micromonospora sp. AP08 TaxID=2604467 RepID=UPI0011DB6A28|nr:hypothetical protein [Micromonospora sp. AP08]TYB35612.1 hypothetical protein FXF50_23290 [Micromonospora sp. AP08]